MLYAYSLLLLVQEGTIPCGFACEDAVNLAEAELLWRPTLLLEPLSPASSQLDS